jgi:2,4-didehydro-3-deoxy-L-rhamnonate hydrolase
MKLIRFDEVGHEKPGVIIAEQRRDCSQYFKDWDRAFFQSDGLKKLAQVLKDNADALPVVGESVRWASCVARPGKLIGIGLNYRDHAEETHMELPKEPMIFMKGTNTVVGPYDNILIPRNSIKTDYEVELGIIISKDARYINALAETERFIAGYTISHDVSERAFQLERSGQFTKGKSCDTFNPLGPYLLTADEVANVSHLTLTTKVNGELRQNGNTRDMVFDPYFIVHYLSQFMTLEAGDVITTGTPKGVGMGMKPPVYLRAGDVVELSVEQLGTQKQTCCASL